MCNKMDVTNGSLLDEHIHAHDFKDHHDHFTNVSPQTDWKVCLEHAEKIGLGTRNYELIKVQYYVKKSIDFNKPILFNETYLSFENQCSNNTCDYRNQCWNPRCRQSIFI